MEQKVFAIYIVTNRSKTVLYTGVTNNPQRRIEEHRSGLIEGFTKKYHCSILVYFEMGEDAYGAISREKEIKGWTRRKKEELIAKENPDWKDLYETIW